jgi:hypothetical protein
MLSAESNSSYCSSERSKLDQDPPVALRAPIRRHSLWSRSQSTLNQNRHVLLNTIEARNKIDLKLEPKNKILLTIPGKMIVKLTGTFFQSILTVFSCIIYVITRPGHFQALDRIRTSYNL